MRIKTIILAAATLAAAQNSALADKRIALVIGNSAYQHVTPLANPSNDATSMAVTLTKAGFDSVDAKMNLTSIEMKRVLRDFGAKAREADVAVIYYAGHGIELEGTNYLIPVDSKLEIDTDILDEGFPLDRFIVAAEPAKQLRLVILDACRDNPFNKTMKRTIGSRAVNRGLAKVEPTSPNTLIAFAAKAGSTASDGEGKNSPFATALVKHIVKPGLDLRKAFGFVRDDVLKVTNNKQEPFVYGSLGGNDVALVPAVVVPAPQASAPAPDNDAFVQRAYELALQVGSKAVWDSFIAKYPSGLYTELAKAQRDKLAAEAARVAAAEKAKAAQDEQTRLAAEGAKKVEQEKAAAEAKKAEEQRIAAENAKRAEERRIADAEKAKAAEEAKAAAEKKAADDKAKADQKVAALPPSADQAAPKTDAPVVVADIPRALQLELRRVGCNTGAADGNWNAAAQKSLDLFNKNAKTKFDVKLASLDALDAVKSKQGRICPLICEFGYRADGEKCSKIVCKAGFEVGENGACEKIEVKKPAAPTAARDEQQKPAAGGGQIICDRGGCRPVAKGCRVEMSTGTVRSQIEVCGGGSSAPRAAEAKPAPAPSGEMICGNGGCRPVAKGCKLVGGGTSFGGSTQREVCN